MTHTTSASGPLGVDAQNALSREHYREAAAATGALVGPPGQGVPRVAYRPVGSAGRRFVLRLFVLAGAATSLLYLGWLLAPGHLPAGSSGGWGVAARVGLAAIVVIETIRLLQGACVWIFALNAKDPVPFTPAPGLKVAFLTTIVPSKEPIDVAENTLRAMRAVRHEGELDVWILDEGDDDDVKAMAARVGAKHFSRKGRPEYNQPSGPFRAKTKSGNHNAWRAEHEDAYDVVAQLDPDHVPLPTFLERTLGYFRDPDVSFVVAPQVYGNSYDGFVVFGASGQQHLFNGVIEKGANGLGAPLLIGTNHLYRPAAWAQIGGYQDSIIEDHLTCIHAQASVNPATGNRWRGVYTPDILAIGEGPNSWADYFNQQKRWAYGIWQILLTPSLWPSLKALSFKEKLVYAMTQLYYPSVAVTWILGYLVTMAYLLTGLVSMTADPREWAVLWGLSMGSWFVLWFWLRRYNLAAHERRQFGLKAMALTLMTLPVYVSAAFTAWSGRKLTYAVTAKGDLASRESLSTFRLHLSLAALTAAALAFGLWQGHTVPYITAWAILPLLTCLAPPLIALTSRSRQARRVPGATLASGLAAAPVLTTGAAAAAEDDDQVGGVSVLDSMLMEEAR